MNIQDLRDTCIAARGFLETSQCIIAGGAPRDILTGVPVKDIDVFIRVTPEEVEGCYKVRTGDPAQPEAFEGDSPFTQRCRALAAYYKGTATFQAAPENYGGLADLCDIARPDGLPIQIVAIFEDPLDDVHNYDFGLSQVVVTPGGLFYSPAHIRDLALQTITYVGKDEVGEPAFLRSVARYKRLREKYPPEWRFANCEALANYTPPDPDAIEVDFEELFK